MYCKAIAECFPYEQLPRMWFCDNQHCFYDGVLFKATECEYKEEWNPKVEDLEMVPKCPSCNRTLTQWEDPDAQISQTFV